MKLFRVTLKSVNKWDTKKSNLYVIQRNKEDAIAYVNRTKNSKYEISKACYLGYELASYMFKGGKEPK